MSRKAKFTADVKIKACEDFINGIRSALQICNDLGINYNCGVTIYRWVDKYKEHGPKIFYEKSKNSTYSKEFKIKVVEEYLNCKSSVREIVAKYAIGSSSVLRRWISLYNSDMKLKDYNPKQEVYMASARRKTTIEERKEIVFYCINNNNDYKGTAEKYNVSYSQVYSWVKKYNSIGKEGLTDKRGRHKNDEEVDELEKLRRENVRLKRQLKEKDMAVELLKKVKEFERRRF